MFLVLIQKQQTRPTSHFIIQDCSGHRWSYVGQSCKPTYKGSAPSDFTITGITLNNEVYTGNCFQIDSETGVISIPSGADANNLTITISLYSYRVPPDMQEMEIL